MDSKMFRFDEKGNLIRPGYFRKQKKDAEEELMKSFQKRLFLSYKRWRYKKSYESGNTPDCIFKIDIPDNIIYEEIIKIRNKTDELVKLKSDAKIIFEKQNLLKISGFGKDERCRWCRTFRTLLRKRMIELKCGFYQNGACKFE